MFTPRNPLAFRRREDVKLADDSTKSDIEQLADRCGMRPQDVLTGIGIAAFDEEQEALDFCNATDPDVATVIVWNNGTIIHENV